MAPKAKPKAKPKATRSGSESERKRAFEDMAATTATARKRNRGGIQENVPEDAPASWLDMCATHSGNNNVEVLAHKDSIILGGPALCCKYGLECNTYLRGPCTATQVALVTQHVAMHVPL